MPDGRATSNRVWLTPAQKQLAERIMELQKPCANCGRDAMSVKFSQRRKGGVQVTAQCDECGEWRE